MDKTVLVYFKDELEKTGGLEMIPELLQTIYDSVDPTTTAAMLAMAKVNLANRYGQHMPIIGKGMKEHYKGMMHSGLMTGLRGEAGPSELAKGIIAVGDSNTPGLYDKGLQLGAALKEEGFRPDNIEDAYETVMSRLNDINNPQVAGILNKIPEEDIRDVLDPTTSTNKMYTRLAQPVMGSPSQRIEKNPNSIIDRLLGRKPIDITPTQPGLKKK